MAPHTSSAAGFESKKAKKGKKGKGKGKQAGPAAVSAVTWSTEAGPSSSVTVQSQTVDNPTSEVFDVASAGEHLFNVAEGFSSDDSEEDTEAAISQAPQVPAFSIPPAPMSIASGEFSFEVPTNLLVPRTEVQELRLALDNANRIANEAITARDEALLGRDLDKQQSKASFENYAMLEGRYEQKCQELEREVERAKTDWIERGKAITSLKQAKEELRASEEVIKDQEEEKANLEKRLTKATEREQEFHDEKITLQERLEELEALRDSHETKIASLRKEKDEKSSDNKSLAKEVGNLRKNVEANVMQIEGLKGEMGILQDKLEEAQAELFHFSEIAEQSDTIAKNSSDSDDGEHWETAPVFDEEEGEGGDDEEGEAEEAATTSSADLVFSGPILVVDFQPIASDVTRAITPTLTPPTTSTASTQTIENESASPPTTGPAPTLPQFHFVVVQSPPFAGISVSSGLLMFLLFFVFIAVSVMGRMERMYWVAANDATRRLW